MDPIENPQIPPTKETLIHFLRHGKIFWSVCSLAVILLIIAGFYIWKGTKENVVCIQVVTEAQNPTTGEIKTFGTPCEVPEGWVEVKEEVEEVIDSNTSGTLSGKVTIGPNCPVEREGEPCLPSPEAYAAREFLVLDRKQKQVASFRANSDGSFNLSLPPGNYTITSAKTGMGFMSKDLPKSVSIVPGQNFTLNIDIDTGIR